MLENFLNLKMYKKLLLSPFVAIVFLLILGFVSYRGLNEQKSVIREIFEDRFQMYQDSAKIMSDIKSVHANVYQVLNLSSINADAKLVDELGKQQINMLQGSLNLIDHVMKKNLTPEEKKYYQDCLQQVGDYKKAVIQVTDMATADYNLATSMMKPAVDKFQILNQNLQGLMDLENKLSRQKFDYAMYSYRTTLIIFIAVFITAILLSVLTSAFMTRFLLSTIRKVMEAVKKIAEGDLTQEITLTSTDEIGRYDAPEDGRGRGRRGGDFPDPFRGGIGAGRLHRGDLLLPRRDVVDDQEQRCRHGEGQRVDDGHHGDHRKGERLDGQADVVHAGDRRRKRRDTENR
jgi:methyl-accepting chemotaxis protein